MKRRETMQYRSRVLAAVIARGATVGTDIG